MLSIIRNKDIVAGAAVIVIGGVYALTSLAYPMGTAVMMGPGYLPFVLGTLLVFLGVGIAATGVRQIVGKAENLYSLEANVRAIAVLPASIIVFGLTIETFGLGPATCLAVWSSTLADPRISFRQGLITSIIVAAFGVLLFRVALGLQIEAIKWPVF
ncbi:tripartite tricarboxylate transporter TctB family protein [Roseicyclus sp. F158]|uniref:Tripartite tricarboxylate transporter TctB family protein n=1 Tax=Tropicimonas omnivorans TaxID=3075590 RepID=A0ABU3DE62_9RHOB|nr:tripartite tricarboxylate transporter TctB family protein [Roseicyclus sp. F158]MDT0682012.1 tripartite tricarboxylate transporter TctB family protein [Roseicyclus sp. F158]